METTPKTTNVRQGTIGGDITHETIRSFISLFINKDRSPVADVYEIDFSEVGFVDPVGVTALANIAFYLDHKGCQIKFIGELQDDPSKKGSRFLDDIGLYQLIMGCPIRQDARCPRNARPIYKLEWQGYHNWFYHTAVPWLAGRLRADGDDIKQWAEFYTILSEIFLNIKDHAGDDAQVASVFIWHHPETDEIHIAISDFGVGIPLNVRRLKPETSTDTIAILKAIIDGFTTKSVPGNRGAGLDTLIKNVVVYNGGTVKIVSGFGEARFFNSDGNCKTDAPLNDFKEVYPGTLIYLTMPAKLTRGETEDLEW